MSDRVLLVMSSLLSAFCAQAELRWPEPTREMRPWVYNWWHGSAVDRAGLERQAEDLATAGFGGIHVIPIYSVKGNPNDRVFLSEGWMDAFRTAVEVHGAKGLGVDLTMGTGWCFGGPQLSPDEGCWMWEVNSKEIGNASARCRVLWEGEDASGRKVVLSVRPTGQQVKRAGPGGEGPMMNPLSRRAMADLLRPYTEAFDRPGAPKPLHFYHDSYQYFSAGYADELWDAFKVRRGYDLRDHLGELAGVGDAETVSRVRCDFRETLSDMQLEDVFAQWQDWCSSRGIRTRNQAHGAPSNILDFYALADVPEIEMFGCDARRSREPEVDAAYCAAGCRNIVICKMASSAAHVKHAGAMCDPLVSSESCTWVSEHFCETPGVAKAFIDRLFLSGVNHVYYHGTCYSPVDARWPGWIFYATGEFNRYNPLWRTIGALNAYVTRVQSVAQTTAIDNDVLVYWPIYDYWATADGFERQLDVYGGQWFYGEHMGKAALSLFDRGYAFDFISDRQLSSLGAPEATRYRTIVVPSARLMCVGTLERLAALARAGYEVLFVDGFPVSVPGLRDVAQREAALRQAIDEIQKIPSVKSGTLDELLAASSARREPFARDSGLMFTRHARDGRTYYFVANQRKDGGVHAWLAPSVKPGVVTQMDPMTGAIKSLPVRDGRFEVDLPIGHSMIYVVGTERRIALDGAWTRTAVDGGPEEPPAASGTLPLPWGGEGTDYPESAFSGTMRYETAFECDASGATSAELDLGRVRDAARVFVNGREVGVVIMAPWKVSFDARVLKSGKNELSVEVTSSGANRLKYLDVHKPYEWKVFESPNVLGVDYKDLDASAWKQHEAGLYGPVGLTVR